VLSSGYIIKPWPGHEENVCELSYIVQMGTQALKLAMGDIVGESQVIVKSFKNVQAIFDAVTTPAMVPATSAPS